jgi:hypothetical protein
MGDRTLLPIKRNAIRTQGFVRTFERSLLIPKNRMLLLVAH